ncbi:MAG: hypothetical protein PVF09_04885 [Desulfobacterales bacterium]
MNSAITLPLLTMETLPVGTILAANPAVAKARNKKTTKNICRDVFFRFTSIVNLLTALINESNNSLQA